MCRECGLTFIGPGPDVIRLMGDKAEARRTMIEAGIPVVPGSEGIVAGVDEARKIAEGIGYPLLVKASAGGGGRGMRIVAAAEELERQFEAAQNEAAGAFGIADVYLEKFVTSPRHV